MTNKKGQSLITIVFLIIVFLGVWIMFASEQLSYWGNKLVVEQGLTGIEAFAFGNINLMVFFALLVFIVAVSYMGTR